MLTTPVAASQLPLKGATPAPGQSPLRGVRLIAPLSWIISMKNFLANERERDGALKRRLNDPAFRVDGETAERIYAGERATSLGADELFEAKWARTVLEGALKRLAEENSGTGKRETFRRLRGCLTGDEPPYEQLAGDLQMTEGAVRVAVHRLRRRLGAILRELVAQTVSDPADVDGELRSLLQAAGRAS